MCFTDTFKEPAIKVSEFDSWIDSLKCPQPECSLDELFKPSFPAQEPAIEFHDCSKPYHQPYPNMMSSPQDSVFSFQKQEFPQTFDMITSPALPLTPPSSVSYPEPTNDTSVSSRKRRATTDENIDEALMAKRQKQNEAAKKSRQKKLNQLQEYKERAEAAEREKFELRVKVAVLEEDKASRIKKEKEMADTIAALQAKLGQFQQFL